MPPFFTRVAWLFCLLISSAHAAPYGPLLEAPELTSALNTHASLTLLDIRSSEDYQAGHINGALSAPYAQWRGPADNPGKLAEVAYFEQLLQKLGITQHDAIVVYSSGSDQTDFGAAARVYWTLKYLGLTQLSILNGGYEYWQRTQAASALSSAPVNNPPSSNIKVKPQHQWVIFKEELLNKITQQDSQYQLLDARPEAFFNGEVKAPTASTPGTIATAKSLPFAQWFNQQDNRIRPVSEIKALVGAQGLNKAAETVSFCNTGHWAATNWFVLSELAKLPQVRLYPASLAEWTQDSTLLPMDNTPSRLQQIKTKFSTLVNE
ncbi:sulfurtransferase [Oceanisphaera avium]|uniref:Rhodanese domain-containing protein n=1 Tax=Oceanisphaera avium TaxID=1903694 RepID=A0A1Y0CYG6_9GAMM|nr:rhodanese-like domain-containing protein [Oceanisphaera avium]ART80361.1 hypothetical protein CBP12_09550 [Oceanisphaera avium]